MQPAIKLIKVHITLPTKGDRATTAFCIIFEETKNFGQ
jgi:hypothetical protein